MSSAHSLVFLLFIFYSSISLCFSLFPLLTAIPRHTTKGVISVHGRSLHPLNFGSHRVMRDRHLVFSDACCSRECSPSKLYETQAILEKKNHSSMPKYTRISKMSFHLCHNLGKKYDLTFVWVFLKCCCLRSLLSTCQASLSWHKRVSL